MMGTGMALPQLHAPPPPQQASTAEAVVQQWDGQRKHQRHIDTLRAQLKVRSKELHTV